MNTILIALYVIFAVTGSTLLKYGGIAKVRYLVLPIVNINISWITIIGMFFYGLSFLVYTILLNKFELSIISPLTVALVYLFLMITAFVIFREPITTQKMIGSSLILIGILLMIVKIK